MCWEGWKKEREEKLRQKLDYMNYCALGKAETGKREKNYKTRIETR